MKKIVIYIIYALLCISVQATPKGEYLKVIRKSPYFSMSIKLMSPDYFQIKITRQVTDDQMESIILNEGQYVNHGKDLILKDKSGTQKFTLRKSYNALFCKSSYLPINKFYIKKIDEINDSIDIRGMPSLKLEKSKPLFLYRNTSSPNNINIEMRFYKHHQFCYKIDSITILYGTYRKLKQELILTDKSSNNQLLFKIKNNTITDNFCCYGLDLKPFK